MKQILVIQFVLLATFTLSGCRSVNTTIPINPRAVNTLEPGSPTATPGKVDISNIDCEHYPQVDGSTSAYPMQFMIACHILGVPCSWSDGDFLDPSHRIMPDLTYSGDSELETLFNIFHSGTHGAYMNLIEKSADIILVAREPSQDELTAAALMRVELEIEPVARDAFVFLVHADNPVESLTLDQIRSIFSGKIRNWSEVGGPDAEIHTYQRNRNSGSQELMEKLVMRGTAMLDAPDMILDSMMGPINAIQNDPYGVGYSVYFYAANILPDENVRMLAVDGIVPTSQSIADRSYVLATEVFAVIQAVTKAMDPAVTLRDWLLTEEGQEAVEASGYVGLGR
jgi:phosphate transport system substrate-binding protein